jgi:hypothetical protein
MRINALIARIAVVVTFPLAGLGQEFNLSPTFAGQAVALQAMEAGGSPVALADTGPIPPTGGTRQSSVTDAVAYPGITANQLFSVTSGFGNQNHSQASLSYLDFTLGEHRVTAQWAQAQAAARGDFLTVLTSGSVTVNDLTIDGNAIAVSGTPNQIINLPDGYVIINEQTGSNNRDFGVITVNAIHLVVNDVGSVIAASATAEVINQPTRTPAGL